MSRALAFAISLALLESAATAQVRELRYDVKVDVPVTATGAAAWIGSQLLESHLARETCAWCDRHPDGTDALDGLDASVRRALEWSDTATADSASNVAAFAVMPIGTLGLAALAAHHEDRLENVPVDLLLVAEASVLSLDLDQAVKFAVGRERPFVHALPPALKGTTANPADNNTSFYSGHTTLAFALAVSSGTVASMRGYRWAPWVWTVGLTLATTTGYLRIAADRHYFTDVLAGAAAGAVIGFATPYFFHGPLGDSRARLSAAPVRDGAIVAASYAW